MDNCGFPVACNRVKKPMERSRPKQSTRLARITMGQTLSSVWGDKSRIYPAVGTRASNLAVYRSKQQQEWTPGRHRPSVLTALFLVAGVFDLCPCIAKRYGTIEHEMIRRGISCVDAEIAVSKKLESIAADYVCQRGFYATRGVCLE
jgi:hypothetical protein